MKDGQPYQNSFTSVDVDCPSTSHTDSPDRKVGAVSFLTYGGIGSVRVNPKGLRDGPPPLFFTLTGLRNNVWNYVAEKRSREDISGGGETWEPERGQKLNSFKRPTNTRHHFFGFLVSET